jgi:hypothetical protein
MGGGFGRDFGETKDFPPGATKCFLPKSKRKLKWVFSHKQRCTLLERIFWVVGPTIHFHPPFLYSQPFLSTGSTLEALLMDVRKATTYREREDWDLTILDQKYYHPY